ncbi:MULTISPECIES: S1 RNA-binding domain-containing protein [Streptomyces]|uniref:S1 RNA-binding domain-containing protein n=1 Tax=Streptomyces salyersiae TaxID=3075530 RepID=A0ABU2RUN5_9ACTN|nr:S1 RNA-binding domain-containing protein [Streptomyces sp. DSM 41770]MDT0432547.1 S1 RNA-binding domain-containing protein [Streptomyces sp. DSM 41770]
MSAVARARRRDLPVDDAPGDVPGAVADGIEGLVHLRELAWTPGETPSDAVQVGGRITVVVTGIDRERPRLSLPDDKAPPRTHDRDQDGAPRPEGTGRGAP